MDEDPKAEQISVTIEIAGVSDAQAMSELKYENLLHRAHAGLIQLSSDGEKEHKITSEEGVKTLANMLANSNEDDYYLVAKYHAETVGMCRMTWQPETERFQFRQFYVKPRYMGKKIGSRLFAEAKERAQKSSHTPQGIFLYTGDYNQAAQNMYAHWGFKHASREESKFEQFDEGRMVEWVKMMLDFKETR
ncbi:MAG: GNAT family N-acetyltransferase [Patescibacteria group bacterium]